MPPVNAAYKEEDIRLWQKYKQNPTIDNRQQLMKRFDGVIQSQVNKWAGPISRDVLSNEAKLLAIKAFDTWNPNAGASLATHVTNGLMPLSRTVYTYQNTARMPENITLKINSLSNAVNDFKALNGRDPSTDELHSALGWSASEINRVRGYNRRDLIESGPAVSGEFHQKDDTDDDVILGSVYFELTPEEKTLFEHSTGYNGAKVLSNPDICAKLGVNQAQLSYKKKLLRQKVETILSRPGVSSKLGK